jgi:hypothetical protein
MTMAKVVNKWKQDAEEGHSPLPVKSNLADVARDLKDGPGEKSDNSLIREDLDDLAHA